VLASYPGCRLVAAIDEPRGLATVFFREGASLRLEAGEPAADPMLFASAAYALDATGDLPEKGGFGFHLRWGKVERMVTVTEAPSEP
jgi:hypothetical protein